MQVSAWSSGGPTYGIRIGNRIRDQFFDKNWDHIKLYLGDAQDPVPVKITGGFWKDCPEVRDKAIKAWLERNSLIGWSSGHPPKFNFSPEGYQGFRIKLAFDTSKNQTDCID